MSLELIHLRKLIRIFFLDERRQTSTLREDIRSELAREENDGGGGDFHVPFWSDAKRHVVGTIDLHDATRARIEANPGKARLYPIHLAGFLAWFNERRRWTNEPFVPIASPHARVGVPDTSGVIKVENFLAVRDAGGQPHYVYPYFSETPQLSERSARLTLWGIQLAMPQLDLENVSVLDIQRGVTFSTDRTPLTGDEEQEFVRRYNELLQRWRELRNEYL